MYNKLHKVRNLLVLLTKGEIIAMSFHILEKPKYHCYDTRKNVTYHLLLLGYRNNDDRIE
jgi:hypothetical protein